MERLKDIKIGRRGFLRGATVIGGALAAQLTTGCDVLGLGGDQKKQQAGTATALATPKPEGTVVPAGTATPRLTEAPRAAATQPEVRVASTVAPTAAATYPARATEVAGGTAAPTVVATPRSEGTVVSAGTTIPRAKETPVCSCPGVPGTVEPTKTTANVESCPKGDWLVADLRGKDIVGVSGVPARVTSGLDLADHGIFKSVLGLETLDNVLGEPGSFLANPTNNISAVDKASWDAKVKTGLAEYIRTSGPNVNFFDLQTNTDLGVSWNAEKGIFEFRLVLPKHVIIRIDAEEAKVSITSANGDRKVRIEMCQSGANRGVDTGHQTLFIRTSYEQESVLTLESPTVPGTQVQILGMEVKDPTAFASAKAFLQGVGVRQARPDYPRYFVHTLNINDGTFSSAESPAPKAPFKTLKSNYLPK